MSPDWSGSPQHVVAGVLLALTTYGLARRRRTGRLWSAALALVVTMAAEAVVELLEYPILFGSTANAGAYYDTIADIGATLVGAALGAVLGLIATRLRRRPTRW
jgi:uncharacterized membrane protein YjdF